MKCKCGRVIGLYHVQYYGGRCWDCWQSWQWRLSGIALACLALVGVLWLCGAFTPRPAPVPTCQCPPAESMPFCQVMGSPLGGRMAQLPEGVGPHD